MCISLYGTTGLVPTRVRILWPAGFNVPPGDGPVRQLRKEINALVVSSRMKQGKKKAGHDEPEEQAHGGKITGRETGDTPGGADAVRLLQMITGGFLLIILAWFVIHTVLKLI